MALSFACKNFSWSETWSLLPTLGVEFITYSLSLVK